MAFKKDSIAHLLYAEDDEALSFITKDSLELQGFQVTHCIDGKACLAEFKKGAFDLAILDVMMPEMDGFELAKKIRSMNESIPILFLTAKNLKEDKIAGLKLGADDYILKPFSIEELVLKIKVFLKRKTISSTFESGPYTFGHFTFDHKNLSLEYSSDKINLTSREGDLLKFLLDRKNTIVKRSDILEAIWGEDDYFLGRSLDVFISRLRKHLNSDTSVSIENVHGVGFRFVVKAIN
jgi:DNA-binding response OmpR family regulator